MSITFYLLQFQNVFHFQGDCDVVPAPDSIANSQVNNSITVGILYGYDILEVIICSTTKF